MLLSSEAHRGTIDPFSLLLCYSSLSSTITTHTPFFSSTAAPECCKSMSVCVCVDIMWILLCFTLGVAKDMEHVWIRGFGSDAVHRKWTLILKKTIPMLSCLSLKSLDKSDILKPSCHGSGWGWLDFFYANQTSKCWICPDTRKTGELSGSVHTYMAQIRGPIS